MTFKVVVGVFIILLAKIFILSITFISWILKSIFKIFTSKIKDTPAGSKGKPSEKSKRNTVPTKNRIQKVDRKKGKGLSGGNKDNKGNDGEDDPKKNNTNPSDPYNLNVNPLIQIFFNALVILLRARAQVRESLPHNTALTHITLTLGVDLWIEMLQDNLDYLSNNFPASSNNFTTILNILNSADNIRGEFIVTPDNRDSVINTFTNLITLFHAILIQIYPNYIAELSRSFPEWKRG